VNFDALWSRLTFPVTSDLRDETKHILTTEGLWGGFLHLWLASYHFSCRYRVHAPFPVDDIGESGPLFHLSYLGHTPNNPDHYDVLVEVEHDVTHHTKLPPEEFRVLTLNLGGSRDLFGWALAQPVEVLCLQETHLTTEAMTGWISQAAYAGWHGVWVPAGPTPQAQLSGGITTLVRKPLLVVERSRDPRYGRYLTTTLQLTRTRKLHLHNVYAFDSGYQHQHALNQALFEHLQDHIEATGPVPTLWAGDFNLDPPELHVHLRGTWRLGYHLPTHKHRILDYFVLGSCMSRRCVHVTTREDTPSTDHLAVQANFGPLRTLSRPQGYYLRSLWILPPKPTWCGRHLRTPQGT
jgi:hypothetical protein